MPTWAVSIFAFFYIAFPPVAWVVQRLPARKLPAYALAGCAFYVLLNFTLPWILTQVQPSPSPSPIHPPLASLRPSPPCAPRLTTPRRAALYPRPAPPVA
eukprot:5734997-Prymnesium_polylepis.1